MKYYYLIIINKVGEQEVAGEKNLERKGKTAEHSTRDKFTWR